jgi:SAM-dependent methyltransferase
VHYDRPTVLDLCGDVQGLQLAELGCGPGLYLAELQRRGAQVIGLDASAALLTLARARLGDDVALFEHNLEQPLAMFPDASLDGVVMALVYHHIDDRAGLLREVHRALRPGGWLVLSTSHPVADWLASGASYFTVERTEAVFALSGAGTWRVPFWRMPMGVLLDEVLGAGLLLERLVEPVPAADTRAIDPRLHRRLLLEPAFLALRARRPA